jgi:hypothetical protein
MKSEKTFIALSLVLLVAISCKKQTGADGAQGPQGAQGPILSGNLKGFVSHYDLNGAKILSGLSGDTLTIDGTTLMATTDATGAYTFNNLTTGSYNVTVKHTSFGSTKMQSIQFAGGGDTYRNALISKIPSTSIISLNTIATTTTGINYIVTTGTITAAPYQQTVLLFFGNPNSNTPSSVTSNYSISYSVNVAANATTFSKTIPTLDFYDANFVSGNTIAVASYMVGGNLNASSYADLTNNKTIYTAISTSPVIASTIIQ